MVRKTIQLIKNNVKWSPKETWNVRESRWSYFEFVTQMEIIDQLHFT